MFLKLVLLSSKICIVSNKIHFKAIHFLQYRENVHFLLPLLILWFRHFSRILFSRNFAYARFRENKTLAKISEIYSIMASFIKQLLHWSVA